MLIEFLKNEDGLEHAEYAIILAFIAIGLLFVIGALSATVEDKYNVATSSIIKGGS